MISVVLADDHSLVRQGVRRFLETAEDITVVGEASSAAQVVSSIEGNRPDVALLDIHMPPGSGIEATRKVRERSPRTRVVILSAYDDRHFVLEAIQAGARGYVLKTRDAEQLLHTLRLVARGHLVIDPDLVAFIAEEIARDSARPRRDDVFSEREIQVLRLLAGGHTNREIAEKLYLSADTVKSHLEHVYQKLGASDRTVAVAEALRRRLIE